MPGGLPDRRRGRQVERSAGIGAGCFGHFLNADAAQAGQFGSVAGDEGRFAARSPGGWNVGCVGFQHDAVQRQAGGQPPDALAAGVKAVDLFVDNAAVFASKGEMRKLVQGGGVSLNKEKLAAFDQVVTTADLLDDKYLLVQRGKKNYYLIIAK